MLAALSRRLSQPAALRAPACRLLSGTSASSRRISDLRSLTPSADDLGSVAEAGFFAQHRPLSVALGQESAADAKDAAEIEVEVVVEGHESDAAVSTSAPQSSPEWYYDEYAKLFGSFAPYAAPSSLESEPPMTVQQEQPFASLAGISRTHMTDKELLDDFFDSFKTLDLSNSKPAHAAALPSPIGRIRRQSLAKMVSKPTRATFAMSRPSAIPVASNLMNKAGPLTYAVDPSYILPSFESGSVSMSTSSRLGQMPRRRKFNLIKIRRKKMNRHKWKKNRRRFRDSHRYNKERLRKKGEQRRKQE